MKDQNKRQLVKAVMKTVLTMAALYIQRDAILKGGNALKDVAGLPLVTVALTAIVVFFFYRGTIFTPSVKQPLSGRHLRPGLHLLAALFSFFMVFGESYMHCASWKLVFGSPALVFVSVVMATGYFFLFQQILLVLEVLLYRQQDKGSGKSTAENRPDTLWKKFLTVFDSHPFWCSLALMLVCWAVYMLAFYPAILSPDPSFQIKQFFNEDTKYADYVVLINENVKMTNHHPVAHSVLLGVGILTGRMFGSDNFGLFLYSLFQTLVLGSVLSCTISYMRKSGVSRRLRLGALCIYCFVPMYPFYAMSAVKDVLFTAWMILYGMILFDLVRNRERKITWKRALSMILLLFLLTISRNNGFHVILLSFPFLFLVMKGNRKVLLAVAACFLLLHVGYFNLLLPGLGITDGSIREALSLPFQQTARYVRDHEEDLTEEDRETIDQVLGYADLAERYDPEIADPVKNNYNKYTTSEELGAYFGVWFRGLLKHPGTYVEATMNNTYGFFYPEKTKWYLYYNYDNRITENDLVDYHYNGLKGLRSVLAGYGVAFPFIPLIGLLSNIGANTWLLFYLGVQMFDKKRRRYLIALMPYLVSVLICVASPANTYFRYVLPYVFAMPMMISFLSIVIKEEKAGRINEK